MKDPYGADATVYSTVTYQSMDALWKAIKRLETELASAKPKTFARTEYDGGWE